MIWVSPLSVSRCDTDCQCGRTHNEPSPTEYYYTFLNLVLDSSEVRLTEAET